MKIRIEFDEKTLRELVFHHVQSSLGHLPFDEKDIVIEVKSKQNYKSEWESAEFRAVYQRG